MKLGLRPLLGMVVKRLYCSAQGVIYGRTIKEIHADHAQFR
jgi:hypothetical protein